MSDGDNATPRPSRTARRRIRRTTNGLPDPGSLRQAPRRGNAKMRHLPDDSPVAEPTGSHADGVTVADLIAKVAGTGFTPDAAPARSPTPEKASDPGTRTTEPEPAYVFEPEPEPSMSTTDPEPEPHARTRTPAAGLRPPARARSDGHHRRGAHRPEARSRRRFPGALDASRRAFPDVRPRTARGPFAEPIDAPARTAVTPRPKPTTPAPTCCQPCRSMNTTRPRSGRHGASGRVPPDEHDPDETTVIEGHTAAAQPPGDSAAGRAAAAMLAVAHPGADRRGLAVAVLEEQQPQQGRGAGPQLARHPRPQRPVRRRELPDHRHRQPVRREQRHGRR